MKIYSLKEINSDFDSFVNREAIPCYTYSGKHKEELTYGKFEYVKDGSDEWFRYNWGTYRYNIRRDQLTGIIYEQDNNLTLHFTFVK